MMSQYSRLEGYVSRVLSGEIVTCKTVAQSCERHRRDVDAGKFWFDEEELEDVVQFFGLLNHWKGKWAGLPFELEDWQIFAVGSLLCWKEHKTKLRRFREAYIELPRKNGKTFLAAGIGLYLFAADGENGADVYTAATKRDQARIAHEDAKRIVLKSELLRNKFPVLKDNISDPITGSKYEPLGRDSNSMDGLNPHGALIDEYHAHRTSELYDVIKTGMGAREQPLLFVITTAGFLLEGPCKKRHDLCLKIFDQTVEDDELFVFIATPDDGDDWRDEETWRKANPNYGVSVNPQDMTRACKSAIGLVGEQNSFLTKRLNIWVGQSERWLDMDLWKVCHELDCEEFADRPVWGGIDLSSTSDITANVWVCPDEDGWFFDVVARIYCPVDSAIKRERSDAGAEYRAWAREGWIELTEGNALDYSVIRAQILKDAEQFNVSDIGFDTWNATQLAGDLMDEGIDMVKFGQGYRSMGEPTKLLERLVLQGRLRLGGNPVLRWMATNVAIETDPAANIKPSKKRSGEKIDGIVALIMALGRATQDADAGSVYEGRGLTIL